MQFTWDELISRARTYMDDDHNDRKGFIKPERWLQLAQVEYRQLYRRWIRSGLIGPEPRDQEFTGPEVRLEGVLGVMGVIRGTPSAYVGSTFDVSTIIPELPITVTAIVATSVRPRIEFVENAFLTVEVGGTDVTVNYEQGISTVAAILAAINATEFVTAEETGTAVGDILDLTGNFAFQSLVGGDIQVTGDWYELRKPQISTTKKRWRTNDSSREGTEWEAFGQGDVLRVRVFPEDNAGTYIVRYFETVATTTDPDDTVELPDGGDERLVLGLVRRAALKESGASAAVDKLLIEADAELNFSAAGKNGGLKIRDSKPHVYGFYLQDPWTWWYR